MSLMPETYTKGVFFNTKEPSLFNTCAGHGIRLIQECCLLISLFLIKLLLATLLKDRAKRHKSKSKVFRFAFL
jgi:hypothetical protein